MKSKRFVLILLLILAALLLMNGCSRHYVDVYINEDCALVAIDNDTAIDPLTVFVGDYVIFNNLTDDKIELSFPPGIFEVDHVTIAGGKRVIVKVVKAVPEGDSMTIGCREFTGSPKVVVDEDP